MAFRWFDRQPQGRKLVILWLLIVLPGIFGMSFMIWHVYAPQCRELYGPEAVFQWGSPVHCKMPDGTLKAL